MIYCRELLEEKQKTTLRKAETEKNSRAAVEKELKGGNDFSQGLKALAETQQP